VKFEPGFSDIAVGVSSLARPLRPAYLIQVTFGICGTATGFNRLHALSANSSIEALPGMAAHRGWRHAEHGARAFNCPVCGQSPQWGPEAEPLVRGAKPPPEAEI